MSDISYVHLIHNIGQGMAFGPFIVWAWMNIALSFITQPQLSSLIICWLRLTQALVATPLFVARNFVWVGIFTSFSQTQMFGPETGLK